MDNSGAIYLSASIPDKEQEGFDTADSFLIRSAVNNFIDVVLGRRVIVMEVHQAVTWMIEFMAKKCNVDFQEYVELYQSEYLRELNPEENPYFKGVHTIKKVNGDEKANLREMRETMFKGPEYSAAVFIGGSEGVREEYELFHELNPNAKRVLIPSPGGVTQSLFEELGDAPEELEYSIEYFYWLSKLLNIDVSEERGSHSAINFANQQNESVQMPSGREAPVASPVDSIEQSETEYTDNMQISDEEFPKHESIYLSVNSFDQSDVNKFDRIDDDAVNSAIAALTDLIIGRRILVWNGNPAITQQINLLAKEYSIDCDRWAKIYNPQFDSQAEENGSAKFGNIAHAIFLGGGENTMLEFEQFCKHHPETTIIAVPETGGASMEIARRLGQEVKANIDEHGYYSVFSDKLGLLSNEKRTQIPKDYIVKSPINRGIEEKVPAHGVIPSREAAEVPHYYGRESNTQIVHPFSSNK